MKYKDYINQEHDKKLRNIDNLKYLPWIGKEFYNQKEKLLIIGESVYNWGETDSEYLNAEKSLEKEDFARIVAFEHGIEYSDNKKKLARNIEKTLLSDHSKREKFWKSITFHELVQRPLAHSKDRPTQKDYEIGSNVLVEIIKFLKPSKSIFLGTTWGKFASLRKELGKDFHIEENHYDKINNSYPKIIYIHELDSKIYFIKHPSKFYTPELWRKFLTKN